MFLFLVLFFRAGLGALAFTPVLDFLRLALPSLSSIPRLLFPLPVLSLALAKFGFLNDHANVVRLGGQAPFKPLNYRFLRLELYAPPKADPPGLLPELECGSPCLLAEQAREAHNGQLLAKMEKNKGVEARGF